MRKLVVLSLSSAALFIPLVSSAMTIHGDIHPERYTFFLTQEGSNQLKQANDRIAKNPQAYTLDVNHTGIQPFDAVRWDGKPVKAVTCVLVGGVMMRQKLRGHNVKTRAVLSILAIKAGRYVITSQKPVKSENQIVLFILYFRQILQQCAAIWLISFLPLKTLMLRQT